MSTETSAGERLLATPEVMARLSLGQSKVRQLIKSGEIRSVKVGWSLRVPASAVDEYIDKLKREQEQAAGGAA